MTRLLSPDRKETEAPDVFAGTRFVLLELDIAATRLRGAIRSADGKRCSSHAPGLESDADTIARLLYQMTELNKSLLTALRHHAGQAQGRT